MTGLEPTFANAGELFSNITIGAATAAVYSLLFFAKKHVDKDRDGELDPDALEKFSPYKFGATVVVGASIGIALTIFGLDFSQETVAEMLSAHVGLVVLVESLIKLVVRSMR